MGRVRTLFAPEIDLGIAVLVGGAGPRGNLGVSGGGFIFEGVTMGGRPPGPSSPGGVPSALGLKLFIDAQALTSVPST
jgi:hypothetical protein